MSGTAEPADGYWDHTEARMVSRPPSSRSATPRVAAEHPDGAENAQMTHAVRAHVVGASA